MTDKAKLVKIQALLKKTRKELDEAVENDCEYTTAQGNGVNCCEAETMFTEIEEAINEILS